LAPKVVRPAFISLGHASAMAQIAPAQIYGTMYGMHRTTIYLPEDMKARVAEMARMREITEALERPRPRGGLFNSGMPDLASRDEYYLEKWGFGEWES
jgi:hypothetical protein